MIVPLLAFLGAVIVLLYLSVQWDFEGRRALSESKHSASPTLWDIIKHRILNLCGCFSRDKQVLPATSIVTQNQESSDATMTADQVLLRKEQKNRMRNEFQLRIKGKAIGSEHTILDDSLPQVFRAGSLIDKFTHELCCHNRWLSIMYHFSPHYPRVLRTMALATNVITFLFFVAITYSVANPDANNCETFHNADGCLAPKSDFHTGQSECTWDNRKLTCVFLKQNMVVRIILFVVIFAIMLSCPINMCINWLVQHILAAPIIVTETASKYAIEGTAAPSTAPSEHDSNDVDGDGAHTPPARDIAVFTSTEFSHNEHGGSKDPHNTQNTHNNDSLIKDKPSMQSTDAPSLALMHKYKSTTEVALQELDLLEADIRQHRDRNLKSLIDRRKFDRKYLCAFVSLCLCTHCMCVMFVLSVCWSRCLPVGLQHSTHRCSCRPKMQLIHVTHFTWELSAGIWGLAPSGHFIKPDVRRPSDTYAQRCSALLEPDKSRVRRTILRDITRAQYLEACQIDHIKRTYMTEHEVGHVLLFHLQCDLLPGIEGKILETKGYRDTEQVVPVSWPYKILAWIAILAMDVAFLAYIFQYAATQPSPRQSAWFKSFVLYLALEICGISTNHVLISHFCLPCLAFRRAQQIKEMLIKRIQKHTIDTEKSLLAATPLPSVREDAESGLGRFNAARYLYSSYRLSCAFPAYKESLLVRICSTQVPRQAQFLETEVKIAAVEDVVDKAMRDHTYTNIVFFLFATVDFVYVLVEPALWVALSWPLCLQDAVLEWVSVVLFGYILLLHIRLYEIYPLVAFLPVFVFMVLGHFYVVSGNAEVQVSMAKLKADALRARSEQRKLQDKRMLMEAHRAEDVASKVPPGTSAAAAAAQDTHDITPVHESVKRGSALRTSLIINSTHTSGRSAPATPSGRDSKKQPDGLEGHDDSEKFESRLHHFMASADKVLQTQTDNKEHKDNKKHEGHYVDTTAVASASTTATHSPHSFGHDKSVPHLRAVDSFYQQQAAATPKAGQVDGSSFNASTATPAVAAPVVGEKPKRLVKKASFQMP